MLTFKKNNQTKRNQLIDEMVDIDKLDETKEAIKLIINDATKNMFNYSSTYVNHGKEVNNYLRKDVAKELIKVLYYWHKGSTRKTVQINDCSLPTGGLFDVGSVRWKTPHDTHRHGIHIDLNGIVSIAKNDSEFNEVADFIDISEKYFNLDAEDGTHWHLRIKNIPKEYLK